MRLAGSHSKNPSRSFIHMDEENVEDDLVFCPHCENEVPVPDMDEE
jgi:hypothetical protein